MLKTIPPRNQPDNGTATSGQAGLEPATFGFGDRRSTIRATDLGNRESLFQSTPGFPGKLRKGTFLRTCLLNLCFFVQGMLAIESAILHQLELFLRVPAVFLGRIVLPLAFGALQRDKFDYLLFACHTLIPLSSGFDPIRSKSIAERSKRR